ncbi:MAG: hypothetical protein IKM67_04220 [Clostridia bacterium]|nr:hypothetical protein [Clostridia bacterium]MBR3865906.1 hypothetical protein [Clostridia bacterium]
MYSHCRNCNTCAGACSNRCSCCGNNNSSRCTREITQYQISRYLDIPMNIYYGEGYTQEDSLRSIESSLSQIAQTLCCICCKI